MSTAFSSLITACDGREQGVELTPKRLALVHCKRGKQLGSQQAGKGGRGIHGRAAAQPVAGLLEGRLAL